MTADTIFSLLPEKVFAEILEFVRSHFLASMRFTRLKPIRLICKSLRQFVDYYYSIQVVVKVDITQPTTALKDFFASIS